MYQVATNTQREAGSKTSKAVAALNDDDSGDAEVTAFHNQKFIKNLDKKKPSRYRKEAKCEGHDSVL
jgi:hypothetical protein